MNIEFDAEEIRTIILAEANKYDPKLNTVKLNGSYIVTGATVKYVDPAETARKEALLAAYRAKLNAALIDVEEK